MISLGFRVINGKAYPVGNFEIPNSKKIENNNSKNEKSFESILNEIVSRQEEDYTVSKHAAERLNSLNFTVEDMQAIGRGFEMAENKGSKNSLMLYKDVALIASIENKTLITAVDKERAKENVYTNIDSVVIL